MGSLPGAATEHYLPRCQTSSGCTRHTSFELDTPMTGVDRKAKKRIQNRVAQRTYRTRIKQRLQDLQQQVYEMQQIGPDQQPDTQSHEPDALNYTVEAQARSAINLHHGHGTDEVKVDDSTYGMPGVEAVPTSWVALPSDFMWNPPLQGESSVYDHSFHVPERISLSDATMHSSSSAILTPGKRLSEPCSYRPESPAPSSADDNPKRPRLYKTNGAFDEEDGETRHFAHLNSPGLGSDAWEKELQLIWPPEFTPITSTIHTANASRAPSCHPENGPSPSITAPKELPEDELPNPDATIEEKFEYVLSCARRVGFDSFDTLAVQYYARNFDSSSALASSQRLSHNRGLPGLVGELRKSSTTWSTWQRRGYQEETLKAAEEICAVECSELRKRETRGSKTDSAGEMALEDDLPNLWALLMGLASRNPLLPQRSLSKVVGMSMKLLFYGLGGPYSQLATPPSQPSDR